MIVGLSSVSEREGLEVVIEEKDLGGARTIVWTDAFEFALASRTNNVAVANIRVEKL